MSSKAISISIPRIGDVRGVGTNMRILSDSLYEFRLDFVRPKDVNIAANNKELKRGAAFLAEEIAEEERE